MTSLTVGTSVSSGSPQIALTTSSTNTGSVINQLIPLGPGLTYNAGLPTTTIVITTDNPVTVTAYDSSQAVILNAQVTQTSTFQITAANFTVHNTSATLTANVQLTLTVPQVQQTVPYVLTVNSVAPDTSGNVLLTASDISGIPAQYVLLPALSTRLGGVKIGASVKVATDGTLDTMLQTVNGTSPDANGNIAYAEVTTTSGLSLLEAPAPTTGTREFRQLLGSTAITITYSNGELVFDLSPAVKAALTTLGVTF